MDLGREALGHLFTSAGAKLFGARGVSADYFSGEARPCADWYFGLQAKGILPSRGDALVAGFEVPEKLESTAEYVVDELVERYNFQRVKEVVQGIEKVLTETLKAGPTVEAIEAGIRKFYELGMGSAEVVNLLDMRDKVYENYLKAKEGYTGIALPWPSLTRELMGLSGGDLMVIVARTGVGKTFVILLILLKCWRDGWKPLLVVTEMSTFKTAMRLFAMMLRLDAQRMRKGELTADEEAAMVRGFCSLDGAMPIPTAGGGFRVSLGSITSIVMAEKPDILLVDGLYLVDAPGRDRHDKVSEACNGLKMLAKRFNIPVVTSTQFNRGVDESDPTKITEKDIGITDVIAWNSDCIVGLFQDADREKDKRMYFRVLKVRDGKAKDFESTWDFDEMLFEEIGMDGGHSDPDDRIPRPIPKEFLDDLRI